MVETSEKWTVPKLPAKRAIESLSGLTNQVHTCRFKGNTLVEVSPPLTDGSPLYSRRSHFLKDKAPMMKVTRYVTPAVLRW
jgi:chorismate-pyruvate lyase